MRYSKQRQAVLDVVKSTKCHPTAEWVYAQTIKEIPNISLGTVYRNLGCLVESGDIIKVETADSAIHYDGTVSDHTHFVCEKCNSIYDVEQGIGDTTELVKSGFEIGKINLVLYGVCPHCSTHS